MKRIHLFFLFLPVFGSLHAQTDRASVMAANRAFSEFREKLCSAVQDSLLLFPDSIQSYRVLFSADVHFEARLGVLSKTDPVNNLVQEDFRMHIQGLRRDPRYRLYRVAPGSFPCGDRKDLHATPRKAVRESIPVDTIYPELPTLSLVQSYAGGRYLVLDYILFFSYIGNETDRGTLKSFFLERVE
jgi:hypothetical protein